MEQNRRIAAASLLALSCSVLVIVFLSVLAVLIAGLIINIKGIFVIADYGDLPCDQPLEWWALLMLLAPAVLTSWGNKVASPILLIIGIYFLTQSRSCQETNPKLFNYSWLLWGFPAACWIMGQIISCCLMSLVFWLRHSGILEVEPGPWSAARPGLVQALETVGFSPEHFSEPECPICQESFSTEDVIKKTPCGHVFHEECLKKWLENYARSCPLCRLDLQSATPAEGSGQT